MSGCVVPADTAQEKARVKPLLLCRIAVLSRRTDAHFLAIIAPRDIAARGQAASRGKLHAPGACPGESALSLWYDTQLHRATYRAAGRIRLQVHDRVDTGSP